MCFFGRHICFATRLNVSILVVEQEKPDIRLDAASGPLGVFTRRGGQTMMASSAPDSEMRQLLSMRDRLLTVIELQGGSPPSYGSAATPAELQEEIQELLRHAKQSTLVTTPQSSQRSNPEGCAARRRLQLALCQNARCVRPATLTQPHHVRDSPTDLFSCPPIDCGDWLCAS